MAVQNLFYLNNVIHDTLYAAGFTEAAGNFQENNFGSRQGDSDSVNAEAQDGGGIDNANFATPPTASNPRMQMYLWTGSAPTRWSCTQRRRPHATWPQGAAMGRPARHDRRDRRRWPSRTTAPAPASDACESLVGNYTGTIVVADRGTCDFTVKAKNVQSAGGVGIIVANNDASAPFTMGGADATVTIPGVMVSQADGATLKAPPAPAPRSSCRRRSR